MIFKFKTKIYQILFFVYQPIFFKSIIIYNYFNSYRNIKLSNFFLFGCKFINLLKLIKIYLLKLKLD